MKLIAVFFSMLMLAPSVWAKAVSGLYDARVPVPDQQLQSRQQGAKQGFIEVLHKVSGFPVPAENEAIQRALDIADQYLYQYSYEAVEKDAWDETIPPGSSWLNMRFESKAIHRIIKQANLPLWGSNRPTVLLWAMVDENARRVIIDSEDSVPFNAIQGAAEKRGIPVVLPLYDLEDSIRLPQESLWGLFAEPIKQASDRYEADSIAAVRLYQNAEGLWVGQWRFYFKEREYQFDFETIGLAEQMLAGLSATGEVLANTYAIRPSDSRSDQLKISVNGISDLKRYASVVKYLDKLSITKDVSVTYVKGDEIEVNVALNGTLAQFNQVLKLDKKLNQVEVEVINAPQSDLTNQQAQVLQFVWQP